MKFPNYLISSLAVVGAFSLIIMACSADNSNTTNTVVSAIGKYQIASSPNSNLGKFHVIDTETGVVKTFEKTTSSGNYVLIYTTVTQ
jgi:hypothetical protein|nr:hypothetical protein [uncultured Flavobacterium sp.]